MPSREGKYGCYWISVYDAGVFFFSKLMCRVSRHNSTNEITGRMRRKRAMLDNGRAGPVLLHRGGFSHRPPLCQTLGTGSHPRIAHVRWQGSKSQAEWASVSVSGFGPRLHHSPGLKQISCYWLKFGWKKDKKTVATCTGQVNWSVPSSYRAEETERTPTVSYWLIFFLKVNLTDTDRWKFMVKKISPAILWINQPP